MARAPFRWLAPSEQSTVGVAARNPELWALKDLSFEVKHGEVLGIIGRNGSGKSTLLKILSRITKPSKGMARIRGRVGTLLEVGAGFHPELTGRENIFLNGAILGMTRREIERKFDEIIEFSECGRLLDTPMKHYSSGMYVRLAFAVAANLETEILLVDEVLAVGDAAFQKKCLGKIGDAASQGRTVLFVSHNMLAVDSLCTRAICLHEGRVVLEGPPGLVTSRYLQTWLPTFKEVVHDDINAAPGNEIIRLHRACIRPQSGSSTDRITVRTPLVVEFQYWKLAAHTSLDLAAEVFNEHGVNVFTAAKIAEPPAPAGLLRSSFTVPGDLMNNGTYRIHLTVLLGGLTEVAYWEDVIAFEVHDAASELRGFYHDHWPGVVRPNLNWNTELIDSTVPVLEACRI
ncbi:MAG TPA: ABC transporter ATP-binding protein [Terracidiphilus sp.]|jgi:lipopolysaccharide transport system ATP-binding protein